jgi:hypothetical protein
MRMAAMASARHVCWVDQPAPGEVAGDLIGNDIAVDEIERLLRESALSLAGAVFRDMTKFRLNSLFQLEDCSIDNFEAAATWLDAGANWK